MGGGKERKQSENIQTGIRDTQLGMGKEQYSAGTSQIAARNDMLTPIVEHYKKLISGDPNTTMTAAAIPLGNIAKLAQQQKGSIEDSVQSGPARDYAIGRLGRDAYAKQAETLNNLHEGAYQSLHGIANEDAQLGLQQLGAGSRGTEAASSTNQGIMQAQNQRKAAQLGLVGSIAGIAGGAAGGMMGGFGKTASRPGGSGVYPGGFGG